MSQASPAEIRRLREAIAETQEALAKMLGVSLRTYNRWETGAVKARAAAVELMRVWAAKPRKKRGA